MELALEDLKNLSQKYYSLAFCLLPEELMATQLTVDGIGRLLITYPKILDDYELGLESREVELLYLKQLVHLAEVRIKHFSFKKQEAFFNLDLNQRVVLFLSERLHFSMEEISRVLGLPVQKVIALLHGARSLLMVKLDCKGNRGWDETEERHCK